jgi:hypothetical protein
MLGEPAPTDADPKGEWYAFEKGALKTGGGDGWADVWKRGCFAYVQLQRYAVALENPPLLIVSDMERFRLHTNWTNTVQIFAGQDTKGEPSPRWGVLPKNPLRTGNS